MHKVEKHYLEEIFRKFIKPHFSIDNYIVFFEWDTISRHYRFVVTPKGDRNKFISFYLHKHDKIDDFEVVIIYTDVGGFNAHYNQKLMFLLAHDDLGRFNQFYQEFIDDLDEKSFEGSPVDSFVPYTFKRNK